ncbi:phospholipase D family protein [Pseudoxanthomonas daejeonensis]|uniref:phospholipase D-like domain-containing protein n=1 Tax=Pseudoxanthomonas daejeonensis TaxID=266062 RepID=UPI001F54344B|nr:phospholipase D family protein [Pseudoxanthomonas daejeonensis]UNK57329.1 phospholipase D family protein [Pseudoxanthomonas daejeonensis]
MNVSYDLSGAARCCRSLALVVLLGVVAGCARLPPRAELPDEPALPAATEGVIAGRVVPLTTANPGQSGFHLVSDGTQAYALRAYSAQAATRSLDIQTYIWHADLTGRLLARQALQAADRGVRVRILVDDLDARAKNAGLAALDAHPRIEVRLYNPMASRSGKLGMAGEFSTGFKRLNHRMHNKSWIADGRMALVGGRNLGNEYFNASDGANFIDLDMLMVGPVVDAAASNFDRFWNSPSNYPIHQLSPEAVSDEKLERLRTVLEASVEELAGSGYATVLREDPRVQDIIDGGTQLHWSGTWRFVSDDPLKARLPLEKRSEVVAALLPQIAGARQRLLVISPYFVPGERGTAELVGAAGRGIDVRILTNSLAANDVAAVHGGYSRYRRDLLEGGIGLWELKPSGTPAKFSLAGSSGSSLHTKAMIVDEGVFVGSYNLDPRSTSLNTEQGVLVGHPALASELALLFARQTAPDHAWSVTLDHGDLRWRDGEKTWTGDPEATGSQKALAWLMRILPVESQL